MSRFTNQPLFKLPSNFPLPYVIPVGSFPRVVLKGHPTEICSQPVPADVALSHLNAVHLPLLHPVNGSITGLSPAV